MMVAPTLELPVCGLPIGAAWLPLRSRQGAIRGYTAVDAADADWLTRWVWRLATPASRKSRRRYARRTERVGNHCITVYLHQTILGLAPGRGHALQGDHVNGDGLDNRRLNLRPATPHQNVQNRRNAFSNTGFRNVYRRADGRFEAQFMVQGRTVYLGRFSSAAEADAIAKAWRAQHMPFSLDAQTMAVGGNRHDQQ